MDQRGYLPNMLTIHERPPEVKSRLVPGHWEAGLIKGAGNKLSVAVLVERNTRFLALAYMPDASSASMLEALTKAVNRIEESLRITLTYDRSKEMSRHVLPSAQAYRCILLTHTARGSMALTKTSMDLFGCICPRP